ncbi:MAG TPA: tRNA modifying enzyme, partial [Thermoplasmata archaeon]|nr:tRNA modifying enzyme [Thermoplasmata archaeon]
MTRTGRFYAEIYGCSLNRGEAELVLRALEAAGHSPVGSPDDGDLALLFTCTVVGTTERRMVAAARALPTPL